MEQSANLLNEILNPSEEFTPIPFWFFNDEPDEGKIAAQLKDYVNKGVNGIVLHPRIGVPATVPYLSESYFRVVRFIVDTAAQLGMKVVLYDEGMYPSGSAHGMVVAANPDFASKGIKLVSSEQDIPEEGEVITQFADGRYLVYCFTHGTIRGIHFGEDDGEAGAPAAADILNPAAVEEFIRLTHDRYYEELKEYFGNTVIAFFTDEPCALGRNAGGYREWVHGMEQELIENGGNLAELEALFGGEANVTTILYHKLIKKHLREIFYARLSKWCEGHGIALMGHPEVSDDVEEELYFHIPGQDLIMRRVSPETGGITEFDSVQAKLAADIARHLGRRRNANECFGVCCREGISWYFTGADMKWYIDWLGMRGVNLYVPHAFYYSVAGARKEERPPDVGPNNIWWKHYRRFSDYMKRLSYLMTDSKNGAKVAVLCDNNRVPYKEVACLYENQVEFNYLPVALLSECKAVNGKLCIRGYEYEAVLNVLENAWTEKLKGLCLQANSAACKEKAGQTIEEYELKIVSSAEEILSAGGLHTVITDKWVPALRVSKLSKYGISMYLFSNEGQQELATQLSVPEQGQPVWVDLWRGCAYRKETIGTASARKNSEYSTFTLNLQPRETLLMVFAESQEMGENAGISIQQEALQSIASKEMPEVFLGDWTGQLVLQEKEGNQAVYSYTYEAPELQGGETFQVCGEEMVECFCNGAFVDVSFWGPHRFSIGSALKQGSNEIKLIFTGNAANIYCDVQIPFGRAAE